MNLSTKHIEITGKKWGVVSGKSRVRRRNYTHRKADELTRFFPNIIA